MLFNLQDELAKKRPLVVGNKKFKTFNGLQRAIERAGGRSVRWNNAGYLTISWDGGADWTYPTTFNDDAIVIDKGLEFDLD